MRLKWLREPSRVKVVEVTSVTVSRKEVITQPILSIVVPTNVGNSTEQSLQPVSVSICSVPISRGQEEDNALRPAERSGVKACEALSCPVLGLSAARARAHTRRVYIDSDRPILEL